MTTKSELEKEVSELTAKNLELQNKLSEGRKVDTSFVDELLIDIEKLKEKLSLAEVEAAKVTKLSESVESLRKDLVEQENLFEVVSRDLAAARDFRAAVTPEGDCVMLDGVRFPITYKANLKQLVDDYYKKNVREEHTVIVIPKNSSW